MIDKTHLRKGNQIYVIKKTNAGADGNYFLAPKLLAIVKEKTNDVITVTIGGKDMNLDDYIAEGIPLTKEYLIANGFSRETMFYVREHNPQNPIHEKIYVYLETFPQTISFEQDNYKGYAVAMPVSEGAAYVHVLQNIWFGKFGEELE